METYEEYKESGIPWVGKIPSHLNWARTHYLLRFEKGKLPEETNKSGEGMPYIGATDLDSEGECETFTTDTTLPETDGNDLLVLWDGARAGISGTGKQGKLSSTVVKVIPADEIKSRFLYWYYQGLQPYVLDQVNGTTIPHMSRRYFDDIGIINWNYAEQEAIADYLDAKTAEIDGIVEETERSVELLREYRRSVISEAVIKGLDPHAPMKDSGVDWIGEIPEGWQLMPYKHVASVRANLVHPEDYLDLMQVAPENIEKDTGRLLGCKPVSETSVASDNHKFEKGVILYSKVRPALNKVTIAPFDGLCSADMYPIETMHDKRWLVYFMLSKAFCEQVVVSTNRVKMPKLNKEELGNMRVILPNADEQLEIADYLDTKTAEIDSLIADKERQVELLKEYRKSLISEAVTGKFEVPGLE